MLNQRNKNEWEKGLFPWWLVVEIGAALGTGMGTVTRQMNVSAFVGWGLGALVALVFGRHSWLRHNSHP